MYNSHVMNRHEYRVKVVFALYQSLLLNKDINKSFDDNFSDEEKVDYINLIENDLILNKDNYIKLQLMIINQKTRQIPENLSCFFIKKI